MTDYTGALDDMYGLFSTAWKSSTESIVGYVPEILWHGTELGVLPDRGKFWVRVSQTTFSSNQSSLRNGSNGQRYTTKGMLTIQIFCPFSVSRSPSLGRQLAVLTRKTFRVKQTAGGVWFRNARISEGRVDKDWFPILVKVDYEYDETA